MKKIILLTLCAAAVALSCKKEDPALYYQATVTAKTASNNVFYLQLNDTTALQATNYQTNPWGKQVRALIYYKDNGNIQAPVPGVASSWRSCEISARDSIRTKKPVAAATGESSIEVYKSWINTIEDGYLTVHFEGIWGGKAVVHELNLVQAKSAPDSLRYILKHDNKGDDEYRRGSGIIAFDIHNDLKAAGDTSDVYITYRGYSSTKTLKYEYRKGHYYGPERVSGTLFESAEGDNTVSFN